MLLPYDPIRQKGRADLIDGARVLVSDDGHYIANCDRSELEDLLRTRSRGPVDRE